MCSLDEMTGNSGSKYSTFAESNTEARSYEFTSSYSSRSSSYNPNYRT